MTNSSSFFNDRDLAHSEILALEPIAVATDRPSPPVDRPDRPSEPAPIAASAAAPHDPPLDVTAELDLLLRDLDLLLPESSSPLAITARESSSIERDLVAIANTDRASTARLHQELAELRRQIAIAQSKLDHLHQSTQSQTKQVERIKIRTQRLATYIQERVDRVQPMLQTVEEIRREFGGQREIQSMRSELEAARHALTSAQDRLAAAQLKDRVPLPKERFEPQTSLADLQRQLSQLANAIDLGKQQLATFTVNTSDRVAALQSQIDRLAPESSPEPNYVAALNSEIAALQQAIASQSERQMDFFDRQFYELMADWNEISGYQQQHANNDRRKLLTWLWVLSVVVGITLALLIYVIIQIYR